MRRSLPIFLTTLSLLAGGCSSDSENMAEETALAPTKAAVRLMILDPGHFHAALVQKEMYEAVAPVVHVYAPDGPDVGDYLKRIEGFNTRPEDPTRWEVVIHTGADYFERLLADRPGNVVVVAGNNRRKTDYIRTSIESGLHVLADKPMVIAASEFEDLLEAFRLAKERDVLLYDIMTERHEITSMLQRALINDESVFGQLHAGTADDPAVNLESVHHFFKFVAGQPIVRPAWFFDPDQQGEAIVDVGTHLVDLVQWMCFPEQVLDTTDVQIVRARRWPTPLTTGQFARVTGLAEFPAFLHKYLENGVLQVFQNNEAVYRIRGVYARVVPEWKYESPDGGDTHFSSARGSKSEVVIRQGAAENFRPEIYVIASPEQDPNAFEIALRASLDRMPFEGLGLERANDRSWHVTVPDAYRVGHEAHFAEVTEHYLDYLAGTPLPEWEVPNMIVKYWTTVKALEAARKP